MANFFWDIKSVLVYFIWNFKFLLKNIFHWTISRIIIFIFAVANWIIFALPFLLLSIFLMLIDPINRLELWALAFSSLGMSLGLFDIVISNYFFIILNIVLLILSLIWFIFWFSYKVVTTINLYINYLNWTKINYFSNLYFSFKTIKKFFYVISWIWIYLSLPIISFIVFFILISFWFWGLSTISMEAFYQTDKWQAYFIIVWILFFLHLIYFLYLTFRFWFSYIILVLEWDELTWRDIVKKSYSKTNKISTLFKFFIIMLLYSIFLFILDIPLIFLWDIEIFDILYSLFLLLVTSSLVEMIMLTFYKELLDKNK